LTIFTCTDQDLDWGLQLCLEEEAQRELDLYEYDREAPSVCICNRTFWIPCPEFETSPETHDPETCVYGCYEDEIPCPLCQGYPEPPDIRDPYQDAEEPEPDIIECMFNKWVSEERKKKK